MRSLLLFSALLSTLLFPQVLKEFEIQPTENRGQIPIFRDFPDKAAMVFYTKFANLMFSSSYGIYKELGDPDGGKYIIIIEPTRQTIEVRGSGYKTEQIKISDLQPRDVLYYEILPQKEEGVQGVSEIAITVQATPQDVSIFLDNKPFPNNVSTKVPVGVHKMRVERAGYSTVEKEIVVSPDQTLFTVTMEKVQLSPVTIRSTPEKASVYINNEAKGKTELGLFLFSGSYDVRLELPDHLPLSQKIDVIPSKDKTKNVFNFELVRNKGALQLTATPPEATITLAGNIIKSGNLELTPGKYLLDVRANLYDTYTEEIEIKRGETVSRNIILTKNTGVLVLNLQPPIATLMINKEPKTGTTFEMAPGMYEVEVSAPTYYSEIRNISVEKGKTKTETINLKQKTGTLQFTINPLNAKVSLSQNGVQTHTWEGMNLLESIPEGTYDLSAKAQGYKSYTGKITIRENQTTVGSIQMTAGSDLPEGMVFVEGGTFTMGCTSEQSNCDSDEQPTHHVTLNGFFIGKTEVTQELWESVMGNSPSYFKGKDRPVEQVSWYDAVEFCNKLSEKEGLQRAYSGSGKNITCNFTVNGYRLPTEAEWEYAARGGISTNNTLYSGSNNIGDVAWYSDNSERQTNVVATKAPNQLGIFDMSGNVWEWCWDWKGSYSSSIQTNPTGPNSGSSRVLRGGSWYRVAMNCRVTYRGIDSPDFGGSYVGLRLVRSK